MSQTRVKQEVEDSTRRNNVSKPSGGVRTAGHTGITEFMISGVYVSSVFQCLMLDEWVDRLHLFRPAVPEHNFLIS